MVANHRRLPSSSQVDYQKGFDLSAATSVAGSANRTETTHNGQGVVLPDGDSPGFTCTSWRQTVSPLCDMNDGHGMVAIHRRLFDQSHITGETGCNPPPASEGSLDEVPSADDQSDENIGLQEPVAYRKTLAGHIQSGIALTVDRIPDLNAIAVP